VPRAIPFPLDSKLPTIPPTIQNIQIPKRYKSALPSYESSSSLTPFLLADIGEGIAEVELLQWYIAPGSHVSQFDRLCQVQSDKASVEITSRYDGVVRELCAEVGGVVKVGEPLCFMETDVQKDVLNNGGEERLSVPSVASDYSSVYEEESVREEVPLSMPRESSAGKVLSSPAVRKLGKEHGIDISTIKGSGPNGRVVKSDLLKLIHPDGMAMNADSSIELKTTNVMSSSNILQTEQDEIIPIRGYHRLMVKSMTSSLSIPHMVYTDEINVTSLQTLRNPTPLLSQGGQFGIESISRSQW
jgi:2-oxoisovalerate dehydrogenase E2 component (dihydrolipoyl transacylase)